MMIKYADDNDADDNDDDDDEDLPAATPSGASSKTRQSSGFSASSPAATWSFLIIRIIIMISILEASYKKDNRMKIMTKTIFSARKIS